MSGFPPIATELRTSPEVRFVPSMDSRTAAKRISIQSPRRRAQALSRAGRGRAVLPAATSLSSSSRLSHDPGSEERRSGEVAVGMREALSKTQGDEIGARRHDDWNRLGHAHCNPLRLLHRHRSSPISGHLCLRFCRRTQASSLRIVAFSSQQAG